MNKKGLCQVSFLSQVKHAIVAFLFLVLLLNQAMATKPYSANRFVSALAKVEVENGRLLLTYYLSIGSDYKIIDQTEVTIDISTHDSLNQNPPPSYPIHREINMNLSEWQQVDGEGYEAYELIVPFKAEEGAFFISQKLTFKNKDGKIIRQKEFVHAALLLNDMVVWGVPQEPSILELDGYSVDGLIRDYSRWLVRMQYPELVEKERSLRDRAKILSSRDSDYENKKRILDEKEKELLIEFILTESRMIKKVKEEYHRRFLNSKNQTNN